MAHFSCGCGVQQKLVVIHNTVMIVGENNGQIKLTKK